MIHWIRDDYFSNCVDDAVEVRLEISEDGKKRLKEYFWVMDCELKRQNHSFMDLNFIGCSLTMIAIPEKVIKSQDLIFEIKRNRNKSIF